MQSKFTNVGHLIGVISSLMDSNQHPWEQYGPDMSISCELTAAPDI